MGFPFCCCDHDNEDSGWKDRNKSDEDCVKDFAADKEFKDAEDGPIFNRGCTDCWAFLLFIAFLGGIGFCFFYGITQGQPSLLLTAYNYEGFGCGHDDGYTDYPYLYWPKIGVDN